MAAQRQRLLGSVESQEMASLLELLLELAMQRLA